MTRKKFLRLWEMLPNLKRAELIGGVVYLPSLQSAEHGDMENNLSGWVGIYKAATPGCAAGNKASIMLLDDCPQGDVNLRILQEIVDEANHLLEVAGRSRRSDFVVAWQQRWQRLTEGKNSGYYVCVVEFETPLGRLAFQA